MTNTDKTPSAFTNKQILNDPVSVFTRLNPDGADEEKAQLELLQQQHVDLRKQQKELQLQSKQISRQIGQAKRENQSIDDLKSTMQRLSQQLKDGTQQQQKILHFILLKILRWVEESLKNFHPL